MGLKKVLSVWLSRTPNCSRSISVNKSRSRRSRSGSASSSIASGSGSSPRRSHSESPSREASSKEQRIKDMKQVFKKFDANGDGRISRTELRCVMKSLGYNASEEELTIVFQEADRDGDGFIDEAEFIELNIIGNGGDENEVKSLRQAFQIFDLDGNGSISCEELFEVLRNLGEPSSLEDCKQMIQRVDCDGNGLVDFEEFKLMMTTTPAVFPH